MPNIEDEEAEEVEGREGIIPGYGIPIIGILILGLMFLLAPRDVGFLPLESMPEGGAKRVLGAMAIPYTPKAEPISDAVQTEVPAPTFDPTASTKRYSPWNPAPRAAPVNQATATPLATSTAISAQYAAPAPTRGAVPPANLFSQ